jgi:hypothetical protein
VEEDCIASQDPQQTVALEKKNICRKLSGKSVYLFPFIKLAEGCYFILFSYTAFWSMIILYSSVVYCGALGASVLYIVSVE